MAKYGETEVRSRLSAIVEHLTDKGTAGYSAKWFKFLEARDKSDNTMINAALLALTPKPSVSLAPCELAFIIRSQPSHYALALERNTKLPMYSIYSKNVTEGYRCGIIPLRPGLGGEAEANAREHAARRDAQLKPFGRAREKGVAHWLVTRSRPVVHLRERPVTGWKPTHAWNNRNGRT